MSNDLGYAALAAVSYKDPVTVGWGQQVLDNITAIANMLSDYQKGCRLTYVDAGTIEVGTGTIMINGHPRKNTTTSTVTFANSGGANYTETSSTAYYVWAFASGSTSIFQVGLNLTASNHTGQANARLIGKIWNGTGQAIEQLYDNQYGFVFGTRVLKAYNTVHLADTDGFVEAYNSVGFNSNGFLAGYTDSANPPTTIVQKDGADSEGGDNTFCSISFHVKRGHYWKVVGDGAEVTDAVIYWTPAGGSLM